MTVLENIQQICKSKGISITALCVEATGNKGNLETWKRNKGHMRSEYLVKCADILGVSTDYILGRVKYKTSYPLDEVIVDFSDIFNQNDAFSQYSFYLWDALKEIYTTNILFNNMLPANPFGRPSDWLIPFKYNMIVLCESAKLITLGDNVTQFKDALNVFLSNQKIKVKYDKFMQFWLANSNFFMTLRNNIVHFDHTKKCNNEYFSNTIDKLKKVTLCIDFNILSDINDPIFLDVMITIYNSIYKNNVMKNNNAIEGGDPLRDIINLYRNLCAHITGLLQDMTQHFLDKYTVESETERDKRMVRLTKSRDIPTDVRIKAESNPNISISGNVNGNNNILGQVNGSITLSSDKADHILSEQEQDLLRIFNQSNGKQQLRIMQTAYDIEEEINEINNRNNDN